jgi:serine phosphatase RsbU (regulator of sigma subunit)
LKNKNKPFRAFLDNFIMDKSLKAGLISKNLHRLAQLEQILFTFGFIMTLVTVLRYRADLKYHLKEFIYYLAYVITSIHVTLAAVRTRRHPEWPVWRRNQPTYIAIFEVLLLSIIVLFWSSSPISPYTVYTNVCIISIVMLAVEPLFFIVLLFVFSFIIIYRLWSHGDAFMALNILLTTIVISALSLFKWNSLIKEFRLEKIRDNHLEAIEKEIELAAFVQESFSKRKLPELKSYDIAYYSKAMAGVSGDMYDFYTDGSALEGAGIFDVSGHGIASGLVTMLVRNIFQQEFHQNESSPLYEVMEIIDKRIRVEKRNIENYLTGILLRMNGDSVDIVNAGHPCPVIYKKKTGDCSFFDEKRKFSSSVIGLSAINPFFQETSFQMDKGDEIILYTDGIKEAMNKLHDEYGSSRFLDSVKKAVQKDFDQQIPSVLDDIGHFTENTEQSDDITIVIIRKK